MNGSGPEGSHRPWYQRPLSRRTAIATGVVAVGTPSLVAAGRAVARWVAESEPPPPSGRERVQQLEAEFGANPLTNEQTEEYIDAFAQFFSENVPLAKPRDEIAKNTFIFRTKNDPTQQDIYARRIAANDPTLQDDPAIIQFKRENPTVVLDAELAQSILRQVTEELPLLSWPEICVLFPDNINNTQPLFQESYGPTPIKRLRTHLTDRFIFEQFPNEPFTEEDSPLDPEVADAFANIFHIQHPDEDMGGSSTITGKKLYFLMQTQYHDRGQIKREAEEITLNLFVREYFKYKLNTDATLSYPIPTRPKQPTEVDYQNFSLLLRKANISHTDLYKFYKQSDIKGFLTALARINPQLQTTQDQLFFAMRIFAHIEGSIDQEMISDMRPDWSLVKPFIPDVQLENRE